MGLIDPLAAGAAVAGGPTVRPARVVAESLLGGPVPLGLDEPFALLGGGRLCGGVVGARLGCEWNADLLDHVEASARRQAAAGRAWFHMDPVVLTGPEGAGRTHVARRLAHEAGIPHLPVDMAGAPFGRAPRGSTPGLPSAIAMMLATSRCANPVIDVTGVETATPDVLGRLAAAMDPLRGRFDDEALGITLDLSEATWLVQLPAGIEPPVAFAEVASVVTLAKPAEPHWRQLAWIETLVEVAADRGLRAADDALAAAMAEAAASIGDAVAADAAERHSVAVALFDRVYGPA